MFFLYSGHSHMLFLWIERFEENKEYGSNPIVLMAVKIGTAILEENLSGCIKIKNSHSLTQILFLHRNLTKPLRYTQVNVCTKIFMKVLIAITKFRLDQINCRILGLWNAIQYPKRITQISANVHKKIINNFY